MNKECIYNLENHPKIRWQKYWNRCLVLTSHDNCKDCSFFKSKKEYSLDENTMFVERKCHEGKEL